MSGVPSPALSTCCPASAEALVPFSLPVSCLRCGRSSVKWPRTQFPEPEAVWQGPRSFRSRLREHQGRGSGPWGVGAQEKLACPVPPRRGPGETQAQESRTISAPGTQERVGAAQRWPWSRSPLTSVHLRVSRSVFTEHFLGARPWAGSWEHSSKQGRPIAVPKELMFLVGGGHKNRKVKPVILHLPSTQLRETLCSLTCERAGRSSCATISLA